MFMTMKIMMFKQVIKIMIIIMMNEDDGDKDNDD